MRVSLLLPTLAALGVACGAPAPTTGADDGSGDLPLGDRLPDDVKADGIPDSWGAALTCKDIPTLPTLTNPEITVSLEGLTVHLVDRTTGFDMVYPAGVGALETDQTDLAYGESRSYYPVLATGSSTFTMVTANAQPCKTWWTDPDTGAKSPVFAGLPFLPFYNGYALHGPIDNFRAPNGGALRRGMVSHGCIRMQAADIVDLYARIRGVAKVKVTLQREPERDTAGRRVDLAQKWFGAECAADADCNYPGGVCKQNKWSGRGFCTQRCTSTCPDKAGAPTSLCVADPDAPTQGMCVLRNVAQDPDCRFLDHFVSKTLPRRNQPTVTASVCMPGSPGWIGDRCLDASECQNGSSCVQTAAGFGVCTETCARFCPDQPGWTDTFCARDPNLGSTCLRTCTPASNAAECPAGFDCVARSRPSPASGSRTVCVPHAG